MQKKIPLSIPLVEHPGKEVLSTMLKNYNMADTGQVIMRGETNWYKYSSIILDTLEKEGTPKGILQDLLISHIIEMQFFEDTLNLLNYIYGSETLTPFAQSIKNYFELNLLKNKDLQGLLLQGWDPITKKAIQKLVILQDNVWELAQAEDYRDLLPSIKKKIIPKTSLNELFGFIINFKNTIMVFKVKENKSGYAGSRCDQAGKVGVNRLNSIVGNPTYNESDIKKVSAMQLCVLEEYLLRLNDYNKKDGKRWFLTPIEAIILTSKDN